MPAPIIRPKVVIEDQAGGQIEVNLTPISSSMVQSILKSALNRNTRGPRFRENTQTNITPELTQEATIQLITEHLNAVVKNWITNLVNEYPPSEVVAAREAVKQAEIAAEQALRDVIVFVEE
jgi:hypothetical protein